MSILSSAEEQDCSPSLSVEIKKLYSEFWNCPAEDYTEIKKEFNQLMLNVEASVEEKIRTSADPLETALLYARIGNYIDFKDQDVLFLYSTSVLNHSETLK